MTKIMLNIVLLSPALILIAAILSWWISIIWKHIVDIVFAIVMTASFAYLLSKFVQ